MTTPWKPSRLQQSSQWWARFVLRYLIGGGGLIYEIAVDRLHNGTALLVFAGIAGLTDVLRLRAALKAFADTLARPDPPPPREDEQQ